MAWNRAEFPNVVNILNWTVLGDGATLCLVAYLSISLISSCRIPVARLPNIYAEQSEMHLDIAGWRWGLAELFLVGSHSITYSNQE